MDTTPIPTGGIVVGIDGSEAADRALEWAAEEAALDRRPLVLVHATGVLGTPRIGWLTEDDPAVREGLARGEEIVAAATARITARHQTLDVHTTVVADDAARALRRLADDAWTVVVGSRGRGPVRSLLLGSVSAAVARHASCPVVVVRPHHRGTVRRGVLAGVDGTGRSREVLEFAYREASAHGLPLTVMHCVWDVFVSAAAPRVIGSGDPVEEGRLLLAEAVAGMSEKYPDVHVTLKLNRELPERALSAAAERMDLLVVGRSHDSVLTRILLGDVPGSLLEHTHTAVAIVPVVSGPTKTPDGTSSSGSAGPATRA